MLSSYLLKQNLFTWPLIRYALTKLITYFSIWCTNATNKARLCTEHGARRVDNGTEVWKVKPPGVDADFIETRKN